MFDVHIFSRTGAVTDPDFCRIMTLLAHLAPDRQLPTREMFERMLGMGTALAVVYDVHKGRSQLVGMATLCAIARLGMRELQLEDIIVDPAHRRKGAGRQLIREIRILAKQLEIPSIRCVNAIPTLEAGAFLEKMGFVHSPSDAFALSVT